VDVRVKGAGDLAILAGRLHASDRKLKNGLTRSLRRIGKRLVPKVVEAAEDKFPAAGGMNDFIHHAKIGVRIQTSGRGAGLFIRAERPGHDIYSLNQGSLRHPLFRNRDHWYEQQIPPGFFTETIENNKAEIVTDLMLEMRAFTKSLHI
jgi:hypothetical protein